MRHVMLVFLLMGLLYAKEIQTPIENIQNVEFLGSWEKVDLGREQDFVKRLHEEIRLFLEQNAYNHSIATLYKRDFELNVPSDDIKNGLYVEYQKLATRTYDLKDPVAKIMANYLDATHPDFENIKIKREEGIKKETEILMAKPLHVKQQFFLHNNALQGLDIAFLEQSEPLQKSRGGRLRFGLFSDQSTYYLFFEDTLDENDSIDTKTSNMLAMLKGKLKGQIKDFFKPEQSDEDVYLAKEIQTITPAQLVTSAVADDSDSSRVECDPSLTLNNTNVATQLAKIDAYIYKVSPHFNDFILPEKREGVVWKSFYWKHKKRQLLKTLSQSGVDMNLFQALVTRFTSTRKGTLKKLFEQGDVDKIEHLFSEYLKTYSKKNEPMVALLNRLDILDILAVGMK